MRETIVNLISLPNSPQQHNSFSARATHPRLEAAHRHTPQTLQITPYPLLRQATFLLAVVIFDQLSLLHNTPNPTTPDHQSRTVQAALDALPVLLTTLAFLPEFQLQILFQNSLPSTRLITLLTAHQAPTQLPSTAQPSPCDQLLQQDRYLHHLSQRRRTVTLMSRRRVGDKLLLAMAYTEADTLRVEQALTSCFQIRIAFALVNDLYSRHLHPNFEPHASASPGVITNIFRFMSTPRSIFLLQACYFLISKQDPLWTG